MAIVAQARNEPFTHSCEAQQGGARTPAGATVRIYVHGMLRHETYMEFEEDQTMWKAMQLDWPDLNFRDLEETFAYERPF